MYNKICIITRMTALDVVRHKEFQSILLGLEHPMDLMQQLDVQVYTETFQIHKPPEDAV